MMCNRAVEASLCLPEWEDVGEPGILLIPSEKIFLTARGKLTENGRLPDISTSTAFSFVDTFICTLCESGPQNVSRLVV